MSDYNYITEKCRTINQEREGLIDRKRKLNYELHAISERLKFLDDRAEELYEQQADHWPGNKNDKVIDDELMKAYYDNPDITQKELAVALNVPLGRLNERLAKVFHERRIAQRDHSI